MNRATMNELAAELMAAKARGECRTAAETRAWLYERIGGEDDRRDAVRCTACNDSGCVTVLSTMRRYAHGWGWTTGVVACPCEQGRSFRERRDEATRLPQYDECQHVRVVAMATEEDIRAEVLRVQERRANRGRESSFDRFNERQYASEF